MTGAPTSKSSNFEDLRGGTAVREMDAQRGRYAILMEETWTALIVTYASTVCAAIDAEEVTSARLEFGDCIARFRSDLPNGSESSRNGGARVPVVDGAAPVMQGGIILNAPEHPLNIFSEDVFALTLVFDHEKEIVVSVLNPSPHHDHLGTGFFVGVQGRVLGLLPHFFHHANGRRANHDHHDDDANVGDHQVDANRGVVVVLGPLHRFTSQQLVADGRVASELNPCFKGAPFLDGDHQLAVEIRIEVTISCSGIHGHEHVIDSA